MEFQIPFTHCKWLASRFVEMLLTRQQSDIDAPSRSGYWLVTGKRRPSTSACLAGWLQNLWTWWIECFDVSTIRDSHYRSSLTRRMPMILLNFWINGWRPLKIREVLGSSKIWH
jgi:hypothetical protein